MTNSGFRDRVYQLVQLIPKGQVATYGQLAALADHPRAARQVGQIAHFGPTGLPWHRVVMKDGGMARGYEPGGPNSQRRFLEEEGVGFDQSGRVVMEEHLWQPLAARH